MSNVDGNAYGSTGNDEAMLSQTMLMTMMMFLFGHNNVDDDEFVINDECEVDWSCNDDGNEVGKVDGMGFIEDGVDDKSSAGDCQDD